MPRRWIPTTHCCVGGRSNDCPGVQDVIIVQEEVAVFFSSGAHTRMFEWPRQPRANSVVSTHVVRAIGKSYLCIRFHYLNEGLKGPIGDAEVVRTDEREILATR